MPVWLLLRDQGVVVSGWGLAGLSTEHASLRAVGAWGGFWQESDVVGCVIPDTSPPGSVNLATTSSPCASVSTSVSEDNRSIILTFRDCV